MKKAISLGLTLLITVFTINMYAQDTNVHNDEIGKLKINVKNDTDKILELSFQGKNPKSSGEKSRELPTFGKEGKRRHSETTAFNFTLNPGDSLDKEIEIGIGDNNPGSFRTYLYTKDHDFKWHTGSGPLNQKLKRNFKGVEHFKNITGKYDITYDQATNTSTFNLTLEESKAELK